MPPTLKKWGTYWFRLVRMCVCVCVFVCIHVRDIVLKLHVWIPHGKIAIFLVFPELSPLVKLQPFDKQGDKIL